MKFASLVAKAQDNILFQPGTGPNGGQYFLPWQMLRAAFLVRGIELNTPDMNTGKQVAFELHLNAQRKLNNGPSYAYLYEDPLVRPLNGDRSHLATYRKVWGSNEELLAEPNFIRLDYPNDLSIEDARPFAKRDIFCTMIASNKALLHEDGRGLHAKRVEAIRFFERTAPDLFSLYGRGWDKPAVLPGSWGRIQKRLGEWQRKWMGDSKVHFPSFKGEVSAKIEVLARSKFSICYENSYGAPGYVTEKIFDCLKAGTVPIYWGHMGTHSVIPPECYINRQSFSSDQALLEYLLKQSANDHLRFQQAAAHYLKSAEGEVFSNENFCEKIVSTISADLSLNDCVV